MSYKSIHGIMRDASELARAKAVISNNREVPAQFRKYLLKYYAIEMSYIRLLLSGMDFKTIVHQGVIYKMEWLSAHSLKDDTVMVLSFRQTKHQLGMDNICVVSIKE